MIAENQIIKRMAYNIARDASFLMGRCNRERLYKAMREAAYIETSAADECADILQCLDSISPDRRVNREAIARIAGDQFAAQIRRLLESA